LAEQTLDERLGLPRVKDGAVVQIDSDMLMACSLFHQGEFSRSTERANHGVHLYDPQQHANLVAHYGENPAVGCHGWAALSLWCMGYVDQALKHVEQSLELAGDPNLLFSLAGAKGRAAHVYQLRRDVPNTLRWATEAGALAEEHGYKYKSYFALALKGWALAMAGELSDGLSLMQQGMALLEGIGAHIDHPYLLALLSEITAANGQATHALSQVSEALAIVRESRTNFYEAELYRLRGALVLQINGRAAEDEAEANFRQALEIASRQKARALELRAAVSLCRLLQARGRPRDGFRILSAACDWFTEGTGTADLTEARLLVAESPQPAQSLKKSHSLR
jgi:adenylate cyclase